MSGASRPRAATIFLPTGGPGPYRKSLRRRLDDRRGRALVASSVVRGNPVPEGHTGRSGDADGGAGGRRRQGEGACGSAAALVDAVPGHTAAGVGRTGPRQVHLAFAGSP